jgi:hypothetical protein
VDSQHESGLLQTWEERQFEALFSENQCSVFSEQRDKVLIVQPIPAAACRPPAAIVNPQPHEACRRLSAARARHVL